MNVRIERIAPRCSDGEHPVLTKRGYQLADPRLGPVYHKVENAKFVESLEEAADLVEHHGFAIRMGCPGEPPSLIRLCGLTIVRD